MSDQFGEFVLSPQTRELRRPGVPIRVEPRAFELLAHRVAHRDREVTEDELIGEVWRRGGRALLDEGRTGEPLDPIEPALELGGDDPCVLYDASCLDSEVHDRRALDVLETAVRNGFTHREWLERGGDLDPLQALLRFQELIGGVTPEAAEAGPARGRGCSGDRPPNGLVMTSGLGGAKRRAS